ncbi:hypothetical protein C6558_37910 [Ensifer sp. NM-2]|nr:hypothetical protein C6558_37910 [Ensifer sp. NM-2]
MVVDLGDQDVGQKTLGDRRTVEPDRHDNVELLLVTPTPPPFLTKNFDTHRKPRLRYVANDVAKHVS